MPRHINPVKAAERAATALGDGDQDEAIRELAHGLASLARQTVVRDETTPPKQFRASLLDATEIVLRGKVTGFDGYTMQVTCDGPWGMIVLDVDPNWDRIPNDGEILEVKLR